MRLFKRFLIFLFCLLTFVSIYINYRMETDVNQKQNGYSYKEFAIVLGAAVHKNELSEALRGRMDVALELFKKGFVKNILLSGDGTDEHYNETVAMKKYALKKGIPEENILTDEKGYNTYSTMLRAHDVFNARSAFIITQNFHIVRAVWVAQQCGIQAQGVGAWRLKDPGFYYVREFFARIKDFIQVELKL